jgi:hypothetical protein
MTYLKGKHSKGLVAENRVFMEGLIQEHEPPDEFINKLRDADRRQSD